MIQPEHTPAQGDAIVESKIIVPTRADIQKTCQHDVKNSSGRRHTGIPATCYKCGAALVASNPPAGKGKKHMSKKERRKERMQAMNHVISETYRSQVATSNIKEIPKETSAIGHEEGDSCNRDGCIGVIQPHPVDGCTCFQNAPCAACTSPRAFCPNCRWEEANE